MIPCASNVRRQVDSLHIGERIIGVLEPTHPHVLNDGGEEAGKERQVEREVTLVARMRSGLRYGDASHVETMGDGEEGDGTDKTPRSRNPCLRLRSALPLATHAATPAAVDNKKMETGYAGTLHAYSLWMPYRESSCIAHKLRVSLVYVQV